MAKTGVSKNGKQAVEPKKTLRAIGAKSSGGVQKNVQKGAQKVAQKGTQKNTQKNLSQKEIEQQKKERVEQQKKRNRDIRIWFSLIILAISIYLGICCFSYLENWAVDADKIASVTSGADQVLNWGGEFGAYLSNLIIARWLGISGVVVPIFFFVWFLRKLKIKGLRLKRTMASMLLVIFIGSLFLGHFAGVNEKYFGTGLGGESGISMAASLARVVGGVGATVVIILLLLGVIYYSLYNYLSKLADLLRKYTAQSPRAHQPSAPMVPAPIAPAPRVAEIADFFEHPNEVESQTTPQSMVESPVSVLPPSSTTPPPPRNPKIITLNNGQAGYVFGVDANGRPHYMFYDRRAKVIPANPVTKDVPVVEVEAEEEVVIDVKPIFEVVEHKPVESTEPTELEMEVTNNSEPSIEVELEPTVETDKKEVVVVENVENVENEKLPQTKLLGDDPAIDFDVQKAKGDTEISNHEINTTQLYDPTADLPNYKKPMVELMQNHTNKVEVTAEELRVNKDRIVNTLLTFGIKIDSIKATIGPTVTLYEIVPAPGVRISKIKNLEDDIALTLAALGIRIIAPIPGRGTIGIEVPNQDKEIVSMYSVIKSAKFQDVKAELPIALGKTIQNETFVFDLAKMPHLLVAGATGQGKSVGLNAIITSLLYKKHPSELKFVLVDPKKVELTLYSKLEKHFLAKMEGEDEAIITDTQKVVYTLNSLCVEMDARYDLLKAAQCRNIVEYNDKFTRRRLNPEKGHRFLPYFVVIIDEFADLIMTAGREIETPIARIAQLARAVGIHLIIATQRPTTNIITGIIKANFPARIAFRVTSMIDSRTILDTPGANQLIGRGDMLVSTGSEMTRVQCAFIDTPEVDDIVTFISKQRGYLTAYELPEFTPESEQSAGKDVDMTKKDPLFNEVARYVVDSQTGSASTIQRKFSIGFNRAGRIIDQLEMSGIVGPQKGSKPRQVLIQDPSSLEFMLDD